MKETKSAGTSARAYARFTGLVGVVMLASGSFTGFVGSKLISPGDVAATSSNIVSAQFLFRLGIVGSLIMMIAFLIYALRLFRLLGPVNKNHAMIMVAFVSAAVPIYMLNQINQFAILPLAIAQQQEQVKLFLDIHRVGNLIAGIFFGLWLFPLGLLVRRSGFFPWILGLLLMMGSPGYLVLFVQAFLWPGSERSLWTNPFLVVTHASELAMMLWLLIRGMNISMWEKHAQPST